MKRILHVIHVIDGGGICRWLTDCQGLLRDCEVAIAAPHVASEDARMRMQDAGFVILDLPNPINVFLYRNALVELMARRKYDVVHSHVNYSGAVMQMGATAQIPVRLAHFHGWGGRFTRPVNTAINSALLGYRTAGIAVSRALFDKVFPQSPRSSDIVMPCGIEPRRFSIPEPVTDPTNAQSTFLTDKTIVIASRLSAEKNIAFAIACMPDVVKREPDARLMIIGEGPLRLRLEAKVERLGLENSVVFTGERDDLANVFNGIGNLLLLPSFREGSPRVVVEARAAGLPALVSEATPVELSESIDNVCRLPLSVGPEVWCDTIVNMLSSPKRREVLEDGPYDLKTNLGILNRVYQQRSHTEIRMAP